MTATVTDAAAQDAATAPYEPITTRVIIGGITAYCGVDDLAAGHPTVLDGLTCSWGRASIVDQPDAGSASFTIRQQLIPGQASIFDTLDTGTVVQIRSTDLASGRDVLVWAGEVASATAQLAGDRAVEASVECIDAFTLLSNVTIGDDPWPEESSGARFQHILDAAGIRIHGLRPVPLTARGWTWQITADMDASLQDRPLAFRDVDAQPVLDVIQSLAQSVGGVAWVTADEQGPYLWMEDPTQRSGLRQFQIDPNTGHVSIGPLNPQFVQAGGWWAGDILRDPLAWTRDPTQSINLVAVSWLRRAGLNDQGNPEYDQIVLEVADRHSDKGIRSLQIDTELSDDSPARRLAARWLAQVQTSAWIMAGMTVDTAVLGRDAPAIDGPARVGVVMDLLDCRIRIGYRILITQLPDWSPSGTQQAYYIDGGTCTWTNQRWTLDLTASANAIGAGARFNEFPPGTKLSDFSGLTGRQVWGVAPPNLSLSTVPFTIPAMII